VGLKLEHLIRKAARIGGGMGVLGVVVDGDEEVRPRWAGETVPVRQWLALDERGAEGPEEG
jgi:hypothetical protein